MNQAMNKTQRGNQAEDLACQHMERAGLSLVARNYKTPGRGGGEVDLIMQANDAEHTLVFVEVRQRAGAAHGSGADSVGVAKQRRVIYAARHYLMRMRSIPPCRFDVVSVDGDWSNQPSITWLQAAFDAPSF